MRIKRSHIIRGIFLGIALIFLVRLFCIQVLSEEYRLAAEKNIVQPVVERACRGIIYDRHGELLAYNAPIYDLMVLPKAVKKLDTLAFCQDFSLTPEALERGLRKARAYSYVKPSVLVKNISPATWGQVQDHMDAYLGFFIRARTARQYPYPMLANVLGYVGEIGPKQLSADTGNYYKRGDQIGISGLEKRYEAVLRGERGMRYEITNARGVAQGRFQEGVLDRPSVPGQALTTTIDASLQAYCERLMQNKIGSIVAIEPSTGEVLAMVSSPSYDPNLLVGRDFSRNFALLEQDTLAPLFHRPIMAMYPPGSIFKLVQALVGLQEKVIQQDTCFRCDRRLVNCHSHPSPLPLHQAIQYSCNPYFYHVFRKILNQQVVENTYEDTRIGLEKWCGYLRDLGLGIPLGIDLPGEKQGYVPGVKFYDARYGLGRWKVSTIRSLDIGQGELLVTPLQMANLAVTIANRGYYYTPHLVRRVGQVVMGPAGVTKHEVGIDSTYFELVARAMHQGVEAGTSWRVRIKDISVCAKTGTAENPHGEDHSACVAFAPLENPQIALAVYVENAGWGARAGAAVAGLVVEHYLRGRIGRPWMENYVLKGDFFH